MTRGRVRGENQPGADLVAPLRLLEKPEKPVSPTVPQPGGRRDTGNATATATTAPALPVGTQVVTRRTLTAEGGGTLQQGATARVAEARADGRYLIRTASGAEAVAERRALGIRKQVQEAAVTDGGGVGGDRDGRRDLGLRLVREHTVFSCVIGSRAFGLATEGSDTDRRGVYVAPTPLFWGFRKPPTHVDGPEHEQFSWELERFCELALKANPNVLECLHSPLVEHVDDTGRELLALRGAFLSQLAHQTFNGYALSQFKKLEGDLRQHGAPRWKHVMHLVRLLLSCRALLRTGELVIDVGADRERLLAVRRGEVGWPEIEGWMRSLHADLDDAVARTPLPPLPDRARVEAFLIGVRRASAV